MKTLRYAAMRAFLLTLLVCGAAGLVSCSKKAEPPPPAPTPPPAPVEVKPAPQKEFTDPAQQADYEAEFQRLLDAFIPPATGTLQAVRLRDASFIGGVLAKLNPTGIVLKLGKQEFVASRDDLDPTFAADLYQDAFARNYGISEIQHAASTNWDTAPTRYALKDVTDAFTGPGPRFPRVEGLTISKGARLDVKQRRGRWLQVTAPTVKSGFTFWTDFFQTIPLNDDPSADLSPYLLLLLENGVLARINPEQGEAFVNQEAWAGTETAVQEGISRLLAAHCSQVKKSSVVWVDIKGDQNNQRLARYSRAQGFRNF